MKEDALQRDLNLRVEVGLQGLGGIMYRKASFQKDPVLVHSSSSGRPCKPAYFVRLQAKYEPPREEWLEFRWLEGDRCLV
jgi:hypothetical protein